MTLADLRTRVWQRLDDNGTFYLAAEVNAALNEAGRLFAFLTFCLERTSTIEVPANENFLRPLSVARRFLAVLRIRGELNKVAPGTVAQWCAGNPAWRSERFSQPYEYAQLGWDLLAFLPAPYLEVRLEATCAVTPAELTSDGQSSEFALDDQHRLIDYAVWRLRVKEGGQEFIDSTVDLQAFLEGAQARANEVRLRCVALGYDRQPPEIQIPDLSELMKRRQ